MRSLFVRDCIAVVLLLGIASTPSLYAASSAASPPLTKRTAAQPAATNVILDTDMWSDIDDMLALAMLHAFQDRRESNLIAVTISTEDPSCALYVDAVNTFFNHPWIPVGIVHGGITPEIYTRFFPPPGIGQVADYSHLYTRVISQRRNSDGSLMYPRHLRDGAQIPEAVSVLRMALAKQPNQSVVIIQIGFSTNLARLLDSAGDINSPLNGRELVAKKVRFLSLMGGSFHDVTWDGKTYPKGSAELEFNLKLDASSARKVLSEWPTPIVASGAEIGVAMLYPGRSVALDYRYAKHHPIADAYRIYCEEAAAHASGCPGVHDHPTSDLTSVLYAVRPDRDYFSLSVPGRITIQDDASSRFEETAEGQHRYLILNETEKSRTLEAMVMLASQPPTRGW